MWKDLETSLGNLRLTFSADTIEPSFDALKSSFDLVEGRAVVLHQAERELLLEGVGPHVGHVDGHAREIAARFAAGHAQGSVGQGRHIATQPGPEGEEMGLELCKAKRRSAADVTGPAKKSFGSGPGSQPAL